MPTCKFGWHFNQEDHNIHDCSVFFLSVRVLRPPGGGSSNIFGGAEPTPQQQVRQEAGQQGNTQPNTQQVSSPSNPTLDAKQEYHRNKPKRGKLSYSRSLHLKFNLTLLTYNYIQVLTILRSVPFNLSSPHVCNYQTKIIRPKLHLKIFSLTLYFLVWLIHES